MERGRWICGVFVGSVVVECGWVLLLDIVVVVLVDKVGYRY